MCVSTIRTAANDVIHDECPDGKEPLVNCSGSTDHSGRSISKILLSSWVRPNDASITMAPYTAARR